MTSLLNNLTKGMPLPEELFKESKRVLALRVPNKLCSECTKTFKKYLFSRPKIKPVAMDEGNEKNRIILLDESITNIRDLPTEGQKYLTAHNIEVIDRTVSLDLQNLTVEQALRKLLPEDIEVPSGFETVGHIVHLNLRDAQIPYKNVIGQIILEKLPTVRTVVNKVGKIGTQFRTFQMEVLAGEDDLEAQVKESNCLFQFNFSEVYWNSRLQAEHGRLVDLFKPTDVICDMFAGVGPFAIPAAKKCALVFANDLNPRSYFFLQKNSILNKVQSKIQCFNLDAREFVRTLATKKQPIIFSQVIMNLPAIAPEFLDVFKELFYKSDWPQLPTVHCYGFSNAEQPKVEIVKRIESILGTSIKPNIVHEVRDVAPNKFMLCVSFPLPEDIAYRKESVDGKRKIDVEEEHELELKQSRQKV